MLPLPRFFFFFFFLNVSTLQGGDAQTLVTLTVAENQDGTVSQEALEELIKQLENAVEAERQEKERMRESMKVRYRWPHCRMYALSSLTLLSHRKKPR